MSRAEQSRAEQSRAEQSRAEQSRAEQSRAESKIVRHAVLAAKSIETRSKSDFMPLPGDTASRDLSNKIVIASERSECGNLKRDQTLRHSEALAEESRQLRLSDRLLRRVFNTSRNDKTGKNFFSHFTFHISPVCRWCIPARQQKAAFTLAETIITMGIIGVVAAMVIPPFIDNVNQKAWDDHSALFIKKVTEALNEMKANDKITGYTSNDGFMDVFETYITVVKRCTPADMSGCFGAETIKNKQGEKVPTVKIAKTGKSIEAPNNETNLVGALFKNGISALIAYDPACSWITPYDNKATSLNCLSLVYDMNGAKGPNLIDKDIRTLNATVTSCDGTKISGLCIASQKLTLASVSSVVKYRELVSRGLIKYYYNGQRAQSSACINTPSGVANLTHVGMEDYYSIDKWAGSVEQCDNLGMRLPTITELQTIITPHASELGLLDPTYPANNLPNGFWSSQEAGFGYVYAVAINTGKLIPRNGCFGPKDGSGGCAAKVICVK